jgi:hypothetical protein
VRLKVYCSNLTCLMRTCSRHKAHHPQKWTVKSKFDRWVRMGPKEEDKYCEMYKGIELFQTMLNIPVSFEAEDLEDA